MSGSEGVCRPQYSYTSLQGFTLYLTGLGLELADLLLNVATILGISLAKVLDLWMQSTDIMNGQKGNYDNGNRMNIIETINNQFSILKLETRHEPTPSKWGVDRVTKYKHPRDTATQ